MDNTIYLQLPGYDKNMRIEDVQIINREFAFAPFNRFDKLNLFRQGYDRNSWIMLESWSTEEDLMVEFLDYLGEKMNLPIDIS